MYDLLWFRYWFGLAQSTIFIFGKPFEVDRVVLFLFDVFDGTYCQSHHLNNLIVFKDPRL